MARLGQHFLVDESAQSEIVRAAGVKPGDFVLEIGPGRGALTRPLLSAGARVTAVETDQALASALAKALDSANLSICHEDFLRFDLNSLDQGPWIVVGNLPYAVGTLILQKILLWDRWTTATLMFQREVALRIVSGTGGSDYGLLGLSVRMRADAALAFDLPPSAFRPRPRVDSAVVLLRRLAEPRVPSEREKDFWFFAKAAFGQRRKMAAGVIGKALGRSRAEIEAAFSAVQVATTARPEEIPFESWAALARLLKRSER